RPRDSPTHHSFPTRRSSDLGPELESIARENGCDLMYEASVGGGIPLLRPLLDGLVSDRINQVMGIVNGTTNYILTKMDKEGQSYDDALQKAQELGFAEADPTADVEGLDAARKMVRSEEHTSELQSRFDLVCRLLLEKKNTQMLQSRVSPSTADA